MRTENAYTYSTEIKDDIPVTWKQFTECDDDELTLKVAEEYREFMGLVLLAENEKDTNGKVSDLTKQMLGKEGVDLIFSTNTKLASIFSAKERDELFTDVFRKNFKRGYYDLPNRPSDDDKECECNDDCPCSPDGCDNCGKDGHECSSPDYYSTGKGDVIDYSHDTGLDKDAYYFNCLKYITRAGKKPGNSEKKDLVKAIDYLMRKLKWMVDDDTVTDDIDYLMSNLKRMIKDEQVQC